MNDLDQNTIREFFEATKLTDDQRPIADFSFVAIRQGNAFEICRGQLELRWGKPAKQIPPFQSERIVAGRFSLSELNQNPEQLVTSALEGVIQTPIGGLIFPPDTGGRHAAYFQRFNQDGVRRQQREQRLRITGHHLRTDVWSQEVEWELKAADPPFDNLNDLCAEFGIGQVSGNQTVIELICLHSAVIARESTIEGENAKLIVILADGLDTRSFRLGYILFENDAATRRGTINGTDLTWSMSDGLQRGECTVGVPLGAVLHCYAGYKNQVQHHYWISDPKRTQNPYRAVYEAHDPNLQGLKRLMDESQGKGKSSANLEAATAQTLWILGFTVIHLGVTPETGNAADIIAATPQRNFLVVECTTTVPKTDKVALLIARTARIKRYLKDAGHGFVRVLPCVVCSRPKDEVAPVTIKINKMGAMIMAREDFEPALNQTFLLPDPDQLFANGEMQVQRAQAAATQTEMQLPN